MAEIYKPRLLGTEIETRKARFAKINAFVQSHNGWIVSVPGAELVTIETLPDSPIPQELINLGYLVQPADPPEGQRILPAPITQLLTMTSSGAYEPLAEGSTKAVALARRHAGIAKVTRYSFGLG
jgi:hypothetical protein